jgi:serine protease Do
MTALRRAALWAFLCISWALLIAKAVAADTFTITSNPPGATVELDGVVVGTTPYEMKVPGGYFHHVHSVFSDRLEHPMTARVYKDGFGAQEFVLTEGPYKWTSAMGRNQSTYYLLKARHVQLTLQSSTLLRSGNVTTLSAPASPKRAAARSELSAEEILRRAVPAVVRLDGEHTQGSGFFLTDDGIIATNRHVVEGESSFFVVTSNGSRLLGKVVYSDPNLDLALIKVEGTGYTHLPLADLASVQPGATVFAIGNPGGGLPESVTRGIVSGVGHVEKHEGTWIQTDAAINPGNSGGPLVAATGEVVGIATFKRVGADGTKLEGLNFALSAQDLINVMNREIPEAPLGISADTRAAEGSGSVSMNSDPQGAEIYVDGKFVGDTPSILPLTTGTHNIVVKAEGKKPWERNLEVIRDSQTQIRAVLEPKI